MATILQFHVSEVIQPAFRGDEVVPVRDMRSGFEEILLLACERIDAVFGVPEADRENRAVAREKVALRAQCVRGEATSPCLISDISEGGMAFVCGHVHDVGDRVTIRLEGAFGSAVQVECVVRHVTGPYIGVQFLGVTPAQRRKIRTLGVPSAEAFAPLMASRYVA